ncbi:hypothetical protein ZIOFF_027222 [Zingiber officinale]|uniref:Uncharacterized protein n=1 Tax=Zingiber officinale TaxID=94328 RepID=A0A8J5H541_ZINOF|nr:hypothetical protein ZIOFF_027222 [Zingiber officinale]
MYVTKKFSLDVVFDLLQCTPKLQSLVLILIEYKKRLRDEDFSEGESSSSLENLERIRSALLKKLSKTVQVAVNIMFEGEFEGEVRCNGELFVI